jgi:tetratricopeptide (TPR) repeat protein
VKAASDDERQLGLAAFAEQHFEKAADHFGLAAAASVAELAKITRAEEALAARRRKVVETAVSNNQDQGLAHYRARRFEAAAAVYREALKYVSQEDDCETWAALQGNLGKAIAAGGDGGQ